jgi:multidrug resistance efflux pump
MRGKWILFAGVAILAAIAAGSLAVWRQNLKSAAKAAQPAQKVAPPTFQGSEVSISGRVQAQKVVNVPAPIEGTIETFAVDVGDDVYEGQVLARIRNSKLDNALEISSADLEKAQSRVQDMEAGIIAARLEASRARADASRARSEFDRAAKVYTRQKMLYSEGATPRLVYEKAEREYNSTKDENDTKSAIAQQEEDRVAALTRDLDTLKRSFDERTQTLEQVKGDLAAGEVHSPVDGTVVSRRGQPGEQVNRAMDDLFRIATTMSAMEVVVEPPPPQLQRIHAGQRAAIHIAEVPDQPISGAVREVKGSQVVVEFISPTPLIKPGLTAQVTIKLT